MDSIERFKDNPSGIITEENTKQAWLPKDSYQDLGKWQSWDEVQQYIGLMNRVYAGGLNGWRLPTKDEALSLYVIDLSHKDWAGEEIHIHPFFVEKCSYYMWTSEVNDQGQVLHISLRDGSTEYIDKSERELQAARLTLIQP